MQVVEIAPSDVLKTYSGALHALRDELASLAPSYSDVQLTQLSRQGSWWRNLDGHLIGRSWLFGLLDAPDGSPEGSPEDATMVWDGSTWQHAGHLREYFHVDNPELNKSSNGGVEPAPGDETGKDEKDESGKMTMETIRSIVRKVLLESL